nr:MAG TPA: hypothetical protein [Caudoviricetes sp.]
MPYGALAQRVEHSQRSEGYWCKSNMSPFNKITSILLWFLNEQAKAFTEVFFYYKTGGEKID